VSGSTMLDIGEGEGTMRASLVRPTSRQTGDKAPAMGGSYRRARGGGGGRGAAPALCWRGRVIGQCPGGLGERCRPGRARAQEPTAREEVAGG
jgi:hypothetical protein